jgi:hypothetical protein
MQNDEYTPDVELDENEINEEELEAEEALEEEATPEDNASKDWEAEAKKWKAIAIRKAKAQAKAPEQPVKKTLKVNTPNESVSREEVALMTQGMELEDIDQLKLIATAKKISLLEAKDEPLFSAYYENVTKQRKAEKARLGASKGSQYASNEKNTVIKPNMTKEEHQQAWEKIMLGK